MRWRPKRATRTCCRSNTTRLDNKISFSFDLQSACDASAFFSARVMRGAGALTLRLSPTRPSGVEKLEAYRPYFRRRPRG